MKIKLRTVILLVALSLFVSLIVTDVLAKRGGYENLFFVFPQSTGMTGTSIEKLEELNEDVFMLTYELRSENMLKAIHAQYDVTLIGTNYTWPHVMNYRLLSGGFFTKDAQEQGSRFAVMNEAAAFTIFGSMDVAGSEIKIENNDYTVTGVIQDDEENSNIYIPAEFSGNAADSFLSEIKISEEYMQNEYKKAGISDDTYTLVSLNILSGIIHEKVLFAAGLVLLAVLVFLLGKCVRIFTSLLQDIRELLKRFYLKEIWKAAPKKVRGLALSGGAILLETGAMLALMINIFALTLKWNDYADILADVTSKSFADKIDYLQKLVIYADVFFIAFIVMLAIFLLVKGMEKWRT